MTLKLGLAVATSQVTEAMNIRCPFVDDHPDHPKRHNCHIQCKLFIGYADQQTIGVSHPLEKNDQTCRMLLDYPSMTDQNMWGLY